MTPRERGWLVIAHCLITPIQWERGCNAEFPYAATIDGQRWQIRVNDFPAEPLYTLMIDDAPVLDLEDWPSLWRRPGLGL